MNELEQTDQMRAPTRKGILLSTVLAAVAAVVILVIVVLPVEYGIDLTGLGHGLGLSAIASAKASANHPPGAVPQLAAAPQAAPDNGQYAHSAEGPFRTETIEIPIQGDEELEYKFQMRKGEMLLYSWSSGESGMYYEFHAEPTEGNYPEGYYMSYQTGDGSTGGHGSLVAPFTGKHGWYFLNLSEHPATIKLQVSGYYASHGRL